MTYRTEAVPCIRTGSCDVLLAAFRHIGLREGGAAIAAWSQEETVEHLLNRCVAGAHTGRYTG